MVRVRLSRGGAKKRPYYHIVVIDQKDRREGRCIERIGSYDPALETTSPNIRSSLMKVVTQPDGFPRLLWNRWAPWSSSHQIHS